MQSSRTHLVLIPSYNTGANLFGHTYNDQVVDTMPTVPLATFNALSDVAPAEFWSPYAVGAAPVPEN